jgi:hypothetical protein
MRPISAQTVPEPLDERPSLVDLIRCVRHELVFHRLDWNAREEIEQEIALWLVRKWASIDVPRYPAAFAAALVKRFLRPDSLLRWWLEERIEPEAALPYSSLRYASASDERLAAAEWLRALDPKDRRLASRLLLCDSWIEACDKENVPAGSRAFRRAKVVAALVGR